MKWNERTRQVHRWMSIAFTLAVLANFAVMGRGEIAVWVGLLTLVPLAILLFSGLYLFVLPYAGRWRRERTGSHPYS